MRFRGEKFSLFGEKSLTLAKADFLGRFGWGHRAGGRFSSLGVLGRGLEPLWIAPPDPKSGASANFATRAARDPRNGLGSGVAGCLRLVAEGRRGKRKVEGISGRGGF